MPPLRTLDLSEALARCGSGDGGERFYDSMVNCVAYQGILLQILADHGILMLSNAIHGVPRGLASLSSSEMISTERLRVTQC